MSSLPAKEPRSAPSAESSLEALLTARPRDLGGFTVRRVLPSATRRLVGPFIFFDEMGPALFGPGEGVDVRPHPHIALATVTYLFEGELLHRDSLGSIQSIRPGDVNFMVAGRGIAHSERSSAERRREGGSLHGIQSWLALPVESEEAPPSFHHHPKEDIPLVEAPGCRLRVILGSAYGVDSPVELLSETFYVEARLEPAAELAPPFEPAARAAYVVSGSVRVGEQELAPGALAIFKKGSRPVLKASSPSHLMLLGGAPLDGERHIWWNFVSSSPARIERAKRDWREGKFGPVVEDGTEFIPLPES